MRTRPQHYSFFQQQIDKKLGDIKQKSSEIAQLTLEASIYKAMKMGKMYASVFSSAIKNHADKLGFVLAVIYEGDDVAMFEWLVKELECPIKSDTEHAFLLAAELERINIFKWLIENKPQEIDDKSMLVLGMAQESSALKAALIEKCIEHDEPELFGLLVTSNDYESIKYQAENKNAEKVLEWVATQNQIGSRLSSRGK